MSRGATVVGRTDAGLYVRAHVMAGTETGVADGVYFVGNGTYERVHAESRSVGDYFHSDDHRENVGQGAYLLDFGDRSRELRLELNYANATPSRTVFDRTYSLGGQSGVYLSPVTMRVGTYNATVRVDGERVRTREFVLTENRSDAFFVLIEPDGNLTVTRSARR